MAKLFLVRHGETQMNSTERFWGKTDVKLSSVGIKQAELLRDRLAAEKIDMVYASNLSRTIATAEIIAIPHNLNVTIAPEMNEIDFGEFEGLTFEEINKRHPELARLMINWEISPRFPGGESIEELKIRVNKFIAKLSMDSARTIIIVAHAGTLRLLICSLLGIGLEHWRQLRVNLASLSTVETYPKGSILTLLNDVSHIK